MAKNKNLVCDISEFQTNVDYKGLSNQVLFTWVRISDGATYYDHKVNQHINGFKKAGADNYGFYWFLRPNNYNDGKSEAAQVLKWIKEYEDITKTGRPLMLDIEQFTNTSGTMRQAVQGCIDYLLKAGVKKEQMWLYIDNGKYNQFNINTTGFKTMVPTYAYMDRTVNTPYWSLMPKHGQQLWQYTATFSSPYVAGNVDMSVFCNDGKPEMLYPFRKTELKPLSKNPEYYTAKLKRVRLNRPTYIYKDKKLKTKVQQFDTGEEFEIVEGPFKDGKATRYKTESGFYITGNLDYVNSIYHLRKEYNGSKTVELKRKAKLYKDKEFKKVVREYPKGTQFNIKDNVGLSNGRRVFKTESGFYITANKDYTKFV